MNENINENIDESIINHEIIKSKYIIECFGKPMLTVAVTSLVQIATGLFVSVLNTCQTYKALEIYYRYFSNHINEISEISRIPQNILIKFSNKLRDVISRRKIRPTDLLQCKTFDINAVGYGDEDDIDVNKNLENNLFKIFWDKVEFDETEEQYQFSNLPLNKGLPVLLDKSKKKLLINIAKNMQTFLTQCNETVTEDDIDCLTLDLLDKYILTEGNKLKLNIYDDKGNLNENGEVVLNVLHEKFNYINKNRIKIFLEHRVKEALSNYEIFENEEEEDPRENFIAEMKSALVYDFNKERYFQPEIYKDIIVNNNMLSDSFFQVHYIQCIFFACMIHCLEFPVQVRKTIIIKIIEVREIFQKNPAEFAKTEFALLAKNKKVSKPEQILNFIIGFICQDFVEQSDYVEIKTMINNLYDFLYSDEARQKVDNFHATQHNLLWPQKQLLGLGDEELGHIILVDFKTAYEIIVGEELYLSPDLEEIYQNWPDEAKIYNYDRTSVNVSSWNLNWEWEPKKIINYIDYFRRGQLSGLSNEKISACISYVKNLHNNYSDEVKQKVLIKFFKIAPDFINYLTLEEIIEWHQFISSEAFAMLFAKQCIDLIEYFKENDNLSEKFVRKIFYSFDQNVKNYFMNNKERLLNISDEELFEKMVRYKDYIDFYFIDFGNDNYYFSLYFINPFFEFICYNFKRDDIKLLVKKISKREGFLEYLLENKNEITKEIIYENLQNMSYENFNNLYQTNFEYLLDIFIEKKNANFETMQKMFFAFLSRRFYRKNLLIKKMFDFMISCEIGDDEQNIKKAKLYFQLLLALSVENKDYFDNWSWINNICECFLNYIKYGYDIFLNYASRKKKKIPKYALESLKENFLNRSYNLAFTIMGTAFILISIAITVLTFAVPFIPLAIGLSSLVSLLVASLVSFSAKSFCIRKKFLLQDKYKYFYDNILRRYRNEPEFLESQIELFEENISMFEKKKEKIFDKVRNLTFTITGFNLILAAILVFVTPAIPFGMGLGLAIGLAISGLACFSTFAFNHKNKKQKSNRVIIENHDQNLNDIQEVQEQQNMQIQNHENNQPNEIPQLQNNEEMIQNDVI